MDHEFPERRSSHQSQRNQAAIDWRLTYLRGDIFMVLCLIRIAALCGALLIPTLAAGQADNRPNPDPCKAMRSRIRVEEELRLALRTLRQAIDGYKISCEQGNVGPLDRTVNDECYPHTLQTLVTGIAPPNRGATRIRFLRRIPRDPITGTYNWGLRSMQDDPASRT
jgi:hypothetical protein